MFGINMGLFKCTKCGCVENTALGFYWLRNDPKMIESLDWSDVGEEYKGKALCSECAPKKYLDGKDTGWGKWHEKFEKVPWDEREKL
jgi:hypothetical protein